MVVLLRFLRADSLVVSTSESSLETTDPSEFSAKMALKRSREGLSTYTCVCIIKLLILSLLRASLAQSAARQSHNLKVVSSSLTGGMIFFPPLFSFQVKHYNSNSKV